MLTTALDTTIKQPVSQETSQRIHDFLKQQKTGVLCTTDNKNHPYGTVIYFSVGDDFSINFMTKQGTQKCQNITRNNEVSLVTFEPASQTTVQVIGTAEDISEKPDAQEIFSAMLKAAYDTSLAGIPPISKLYAGHYVTYRIKPQRISMAVFARPDPGGYEMYETIDFNS